MQRIAPIGWPPTPQGVPPEPWAFTASDIEIYDDVLDAKSQARLFEFLSGPGWAFGAYSDAAAGASRYWYKHFAGYFGNSQEPGDAKAFEMQLESNAPLIAAMWARIRRSLLPEHELSRCYANAYPYGSEGGLHMDSNVRSHFTSIYYPSPTWSPNFAGETIFFNKDGSDVLKAVYPKPNRLVVFPGVIPHVARGVSRSFTGLRITLMFKTSKG